MFTILLVHGTVDSYTVGVQSKGAYFRTHSEICALGFLSTDVQDEASTRSGRKRTEAHEIIAPEMERKSIPPGKKKKASVPYTVYREIPRQAPSSRRAFRWPCSRRLIVLTLSCTRLPL